MKEGEQSLWERRPGNGTLPHRRRHQGRRRLYLVVSHMISRTWEIRTIAGDEQSLGTGGKPSPFQLPIVSIQQDLGLYLALIIIVAYSTSVVRYQK